LDVLSSVFFFLVCVPSSTDEVACLHADKAVDGGGDTWWWRPLCDVGLDDQVEGIALAIIIDGCGSSGKKNGSSDASHASS